jgi:beta-glucosidase
MGFDGFVVSDWNGISEVPGCRNDSCPHGINAGIDMIMVPDDWRAFIANTIAQVKAGEIPMSRIDDAVTRILRVKLRAGLFDKSPSENVYAGKDAGLQDRELARRAVRESMVLLKNEGPVLPLARGKKILVVGKSADNIPNQTGGWSLTWQGTDNTNADFPNADSILAGIRAAAGEGNVEFSADAKGIDLSRFDAVIAVVGERPYAEGDGDIGPSGTLRHSSRYPEDLAVLEAVAGKGKPVITVFVAGRPLFVNDLLNLSDTFVAAWLPGTEGKGVSDLLVAGPRSYDFRGKLSFSWPKSACQTPLNFGDAGYAPLFALNYGLRKGQRSKLGKLDTSYAPGGCGASNTVPVHGQADRASFPLMIRSGSEQLVLGADLNATFRLRGIAVQTAQVNTQQDAKMVTWSAGAPGGAALVARGGKAIVLPPSAVQDGALQFDAIVPAAPQGKVTLAMQDTPLDATSLFTRLAGKGRQSIKLPLACFTARGLQLERMDAPFAISAGAPFTVAIANIEIAGGAATAPDAVRCEELKQEN